MAKYFETEIREAFEKKYLKVFIKDISIIEEVREIISSLDSVKTANVTESQSKSNRGLTLTIYPNKVYDIEETKQEVESALNTYFSGITSIVEKPEIKETQGWLAKHPEAQKVYDEAIKKYNQKSFQRNLLDDMRLSLEILLKSVLGNQKSLENQLPELGKYQKDKGLSPEFTNMFNKLLDYYAKYQNTYVKHDDAINFKEIDFVIHQTTAFMRCLL